MIKCTHSIDTVMLQCLMITTFAIQKTAYPIYYAYCYLSRMGSTMWDISKGLSTITLMKCTCPQKLASTTTTIYQVHSNTWYHFTMSEHFVTFDFVSLWSLYSIFFTTSSVKDEHHVCTLVKLVQDEKHVRPN